MTRAEIAVLRLARLILKHAHRTPEACGHGPVDCLACLADAADDEIQRTTKRKPKKGARRGR